MSNYKKQKRELTEKVKEQIVRKNKYLAKHMIWLGIVADIVLLGLILFFGEPSLFALLVAGVAAIVILIGPVVAYITTGNKTRAILQQGAIRYSTPMQVEYVQEHKVKGSLIRATYTLIADGKEYEVDRDIYKHCKIGDQVLMVRIPAMKEKDCIFVKCTDDML